MQPPRTITAGVYVNVRTQKLKTIRKLRTLLPSYNRIINVNDVFMPHKSIFSIDLLELTNWTIDSGQLVLKASLTGSELINVEFNLNSHNGLLLVKIKGQLEKFIQRAQFRIDIFTDDALRRSFDLNVYFHNKFSVIDKNRVYFNRKFYRAAAEDIRLDSLLFSEVSGLNKQVVFQIDDEDTFRIRPDSSLQVLRIGESPVTKQVQVTACHRLSCDHTTIFIQLKPNSEKIQPISTSTTAASTIPTTTNGADRLEVTPSSIIVFIVLVSLIGLTSSVTVLAVVYLRRIRPKPASKSNSRKQLEMSVSSVDQNGSLSSSEGSSTFLPSQSNQNFLSSEVFESEFEMLRFTLNWEPTFGQFKTVISDFEKFDAVMQRPFDEADCCSQVDENQQTFV